MTPEPAPFTRVAIVGLGVMGGSVARGLGTLVDRPVRVGWSPDPAERSAARDADAVDLAAESLDEAVRDADLVVLAAPLAATCALLPRVAAAAEHAVLTDVASLKVPVARAAGAAGVTDRWIGSHPMAGSAASGFGASRADLFAGARVHLVADRSADGPLRRVESLWRLLGARPEPAEAETHDELMTVVSHLPQLASNALAEVLLGLGVSPDALGPGGRDMTRLAASDPTMWGDLLGADPGSADHLDALARALQRLAGELRGGDRAALEASMERTRRWVTGR